MTRNLFLGADLSPAYRALAGPDGPARLPAVVAAIFNPSPPLGMVQRTGFATRAVALAGEIAATEPDVIGLQEAAVWSVDGEPAVDCLAPLEAEPAATALPVVLLGDFNARPEGATYAYVLGAGFEDAWTQANPGGAAGFTCCHRQPLDDPWDALRARIDLILVRGGLVATEASVVGDFSGGLWPSDHQGVVAVVTGPNFI